ncbi:MAG: ComF family protein [Pseudochelatococcus sp.]|jgi:ComF family protein|uniref:ComF family protein n=1 Tax=Pseudochelatococcus sp. TaxID=2020869 RepID=UPI003D8CD0A1
MAPLHPQIQPTPHETPAARKAGEIGRHVRAGWHALLDFLYPPACPVCLAATAQHDGLCATCWSGLSLIERPYCERLGLPFDIDVGTPLLSPAALADPPAFQRARAAVRYDATARLLVHRLKYSDRAELARLMAGMMIRAGRDLLPDADLIVPVPLHTRRLWARRFNQSALLGMRLSAHTGLPCDTAALARRKPTRPQAGLSRAERATNLQGAFHVGEHRRMAVEGRRILLVDDVLTTGATANACARALLRAGARDVDVLVFARVVAAN